MAPKGGNAKKESGRAKKAENEAKKAEAAAAERVRVTGTHLPRTGLNFGHNRNVKRQLHGRIQHPRLQRPKPIRKRKERLIWHEKPKTLVC